MASLNNTKMGLGFFKATVPGVWWANEPNREPYADEYVAFGLPEITRRNGGRTPPLH